MALTRLLLITLRGSPLSSLRVPSFHWPLIKSLGLASRHNRRSCWAVRSAKRTIATHHVSANRIRSANRNADAIADLSRLIFLTFLHWPRLGFHQRMAREYCLLLAPLLLPPGPYSCFSLCKLRVRSCSLTPQLIKSFTHQFLMNSLPFLSGFFALLWKLIILLYYTLIVVTRRQIHYMNDGSFEAVD